MVKKITAILFLVLFFEALGMLVLFRHARLAELAPANAQEDNYQLRQMEKAVSSLKLESAEKSWVLDEKTVPAWKEAKLASGLTSDPLAAYFNEQTGLPPDWTNNNLSANMTSLAIDEKALGEFLLKLALDTNQDPQDAQLQIEEGRAVKFTPHESGKILDLKAARELIASAAAATGETTVTLPIHFYAPNVVLGDLNDLGIKELLSRGQTDFTGSSNSRIQNVRVGASQYNGLIIPPGEEFSFNKNLGPIDAAHGYLPELVIKPEGTVPEFGGGLCQVSSTAFRAALYSGLPITQRRNHSYAVRYYEWISDDQPRAPGLDATIYPGAQDLKFVNNTPGTILIATHIEGKRLYFDFYGTHDGREVTVSQPEVYDRRANGAVKAKVTRKILRDGQEPIENVIASSYVSPNLYPKVYEYPKTETTPPAEPIPPISN
ncbi:MAG: VanW family protein [Candidatus Doudnabacteria bacterium]|nr:VanW family protein [bacterium]MDZ4243943.1 VanW family protein [Candidatus Doudnabacteria bacterium]